MNALKTDLYQLTMMAAYNNFSIENNFATFDLFFRNLPKNRNYMISAGLEEALIYLQNVHFKNEQVNYLKKLPVFSSQHNSFFELLKNFKFEGDVWAMPEGTIVFGHEPILTIRAPIYQAQLVETYLLNIFGSRTMFASKASRIVDASAPAQVFEFGSRRSHDPEASIACARSSYIVGCLGTSNVEAGYRYGIPIVGTMAHSFVMSFDSELEAFRAYAKTFPNNTIILVDTYNTIEGVKKAIIVAKEMEERGEKLKGIRIDSGDLAELSKIARKMFDDAGLNYVKITLSNDLSEESIIELRKKGACFDSLGVGTLLATSKDAPYVGIVYKMSEIEKNGEMNPRIKVCGTKTTLPGLKQVYRFMSNNYYSHDIIGFANEEMPNAQKLLVKVMEKGKLVYELPNLNQIREYVAIQKELLTPELRGVDNEIKYSVSVSNEVKNIQNVLINKSIDDVQRGNDMKNIIVWNVDTQKDFMCNNGALYTPNAEEIIPNLKKIFDCAKIHNIKILGSADEHNKESIEFSNLNLPAHCITKTEGQINIPETLLEQVGILNWNSVYNNKEYNEILSKQQVIITKDAVNVSSSPHYNKLIENIHNTSIYVTGVVTEFCVVAAIRSLVESTKNKNCKIIVVEDAIKELSLIEKEKVFSEFKKLGVKIVKTNDLLNTIKKQEELKSPSLNISKIERKNDTEKISIDKVKQ